MPTEIISWKGKTFNEISSAIKKNEGNNGAANIKGIFKANPLKIYRRERSVFNCTNRTSTSLDVINAPGGTTVNSTAQECKGLRTIVDINLTENKSERPGTSSVCFSTAEHAKRRVRSNGMIKKNYNVNKNNDQYYTSSSQYLESRAKTFAQNQYYNIRKGDVTIKPGSNRSMFNVYASNGISHCPKFIITKDVTFSYIWIDNTEHVVNIPAGDQEVGTIREKLRDAQEANRHYFILKNENNRKRFLIDLTYDRDQEKYIFILERGGKVSYDERLTAFDIERNEDGDTLWNNPTVDKIPQIRITDPEILEGLGFEGVGPNNEKNIPIFDVDDPNNANYAAENNRFEGVSNKKAKILPQYSAIYYKPSNFKMGVQGAVDSSARLTRLKYDTVTDNAGKYMNAYGRSVGNALAYGVAEGGYTIKDKIGFPLKCTPKFSRYYKDGQRNCSASSTQAIKYHQSKI
jgi:hypothetical protein